MNDFMTKMLGASWRSTLGGIFLGMPPVIATAAASASLPLAHWAQFALALSTGIGALILGFNAKDKQVHSTATEVDAATKKID